MTDSNILGMVTGGILSVSIRDSSKLFSNVAQTAHCKNERCVTIWLFPCNVQLLHSHASCRHAGG